MRPVTHEDEAGLSLHRRVAYLGVGAMVLSAVAAAATAIAAVQVSGFDGPTQGLLATQVATVVGLAIFGVASFVLLRRWVTQPIRALADDTRRVSEGDLSHRVSAVGSSDLAQLGADIEAMRQRIVTELEVVTDARAVLDEQAVELRRSNSELEQFAYVASHDLQEPLRKVASFCQLLERRYAGELDDRAQEYIAFAVDGAKRMQALINDLLAFSRVGRSTARFEDVELGSLAADALVDLSGRIEAEQAKIEIDDHLPVVPGDRSLLRAVLVNVMGNALKFRGEAPPHLRVWADDMDSMWAIHVADNGIGIPDAYTERVFVIFQRLHGRDEYEGTGIGLALCRKIVEFHGGRMWIEPFEEGSGTTVGFTLPKHADIPIRHDQEELSR
jgi:signal transduction histidine kinase